MSCLEAIRERILARDRELVLHKEADKQLAAANADAATLFGHIQHHATAKELEDGMPTWVDTYSSIDKQLSSITTKMAMLVEENELLIRLLGLHKGLESDALDAAEKHLLSVEIINSSPIALQGRINDAANTEAQNVKAKFRRDNQ